jgi:hypothetical protein
MGVRLAIAFLPLCLVAQSVQRHQLTGLVTDSSGKPVEGAWIDHTGNGKYPRWEYSTTPEGRFDLWTGAPAVVIRKAGYDSVRLMIKDQKDPEDVRVVLRPVSAAPAPKASGEPCKVESHDLNDVDFTATSIGARDKNGKRWAILCGQGFNWSYGVPNNANVWQSVEYSEAMTGVPKLGVVDARGKTPDGKYWRDRGMLGRSCSYWRADESAVALLDTIMDGRCTDQSGSPVTPAQR